MTNAAHFKYLREITGCGTHEAVNALRLCNDDLLLAEGYLRYNGCAVAVRPKPGQTPQQAYEEWVWGNARAWKAQVIAGDRPV